MGSGTLRRRGWAAALVVALATTGMGGIADAAATRADIETCSNGTVPAQRAAACAAVLGDASIGAKQRAYVHFARGMALIDQNQPDAALDDLSAAIRLDPEMWPSYWVRGELLGRRRSYGDANADLSEVIRRNPKTASLFWMRGITLDYLGRSEEARADYGKAIELAGPKDPVDSFYNDRANSYEADHQWQPALADYDAALQRNGDLAVAAAGRGRVRFLSGDARGAVPDFLKAADAKPDNGYYPMWLYLAQSRAGRKDAATELRRRAQGLDPGKWPTPIIRILLGDLREDQVKMPAEPAAWSEADRKAAANCELSFFLGEQDLLRGDRAKATQRFRAAIATGILEYIEYRAATAEVDRLAR